MGNLFGGKKTAKRQAKALADATNTQTAAITDATDKQVAAAQEAARQAAENSRLVAEAADRQSAQLAANGAAAAEAAKAQLTLIEQNAARQDAASAAQMTLIQEQAAASRAAQDQMARDQRDMAVANQREKENAIARDLASQRAAEAVENIDDAPVEVTLASDDPNTNAEIDPVTRRRRPVRASFMSSGAGITI